MKNKISVICLVKEFKNYEREIKSATRKILGILKQKNVLVEIYLAGNGQMRFLNRKFRGKSKAANVLSFEEPEKFANPKSKLKKIGEIYLNMEQKDKLISKEFLLIHGILHLFGYDHKKKSDRIKMEKKEKYLMSNI